MYNGNCNLPYIHKEWINKESVKQCVVFLEDGEYGSVIYDLGIYTKIDNTFIIEAKNIGLLKNEKLDDILMTVILKNDDVDKDKIIDFFRLQQGYKNIEFLEGKYDYEVLLKR